MHIKRIKIYNDVDMTHYEIMYHKNTEITMQDIIKRIVNDVIKISSANVSRSFGLNFEKIQFEPNDDYSVIRFYIEEQMCSGYLCRVCTHCIEIK
jgi:hypothetical protein